MSIRPTDRIDNDAVCVSVHVAAEPATVWSFFDDAERFAAWMGAFAGQPPLAGTRIEPRVGGGVRICYPGGEVARGQITSFEVPHRVVFTWGYEGGRAPAAGESQVEVTLSPAEGGTLVQLRHSGLPDERTRRDHLGGWKHYLSMLAIQAAGRQQAPSLSGVLDGYVRAWRETDPATRARLLSECCEPDVRFRSAFACTDTLDELNEHIANGQRHMPGMELHSVGAAQAVHAQARCGWAVRAPDGRDVMRGENVFTLTLRGRIAQVVSFPGAAGG